MSYPLNGPNKVPGILEAQNMKNNGGGGNLGYMKRQKKDEKKKDEIDVFNSSIDDNDEFLPSDPEDMPKKTPKESIMDKASDFINKFKKK